MNLDQQLAVVKDAQTNYNKTLFDMKNFIDGLVILDLDKDGIPSIKSLIPINSKFNSMTKTICNARKRLYDEVSLYNEMYVRNLNKNGVE